jgi:hypothetical protein
MDHLVDVPVTRTADCKIILTLEYWQLDDIKKGLTQLYKQREKSRHYSEKKKHLESKDPVEFRPLKPIINLQTLV